MKISHLLIVSKNFNEKFLIWKNETDFHLKKIMKISFIVWNQTGIFRSPVLHLIVGRFKHASQYHDLIFSWREKGILWMITLLREFCRISWTVASSSTKVSACGFEYNIYQACQQIRLFDILADRLNGNLVR